MALQVSHTSFSSCFWLASKLAPLGSLVGSTCRAVHVVMLVHTHTRVCTCALIICSICVCICEYGTCVCSKITSKSASLSRIPMTRPPKVDLRYCQHNRRHTCARTIEQTDTVTLTQSLYSGLPPESTQLHADKANLVRTHHYMASFYARTGTQITN